MDLNTLLQRLVAADREYRAAAKDAQANGARLVKDARESLELTQRELAEKLNVDHTYISKIENGHQQVGKPFLRKLVQLLDTQESIL